MLQPISRAKAYPGSINQDSLEVFDLNINDTTMYGTYPTLKTGEGVSNPAAITEITITQTLSAQLDSLIDQTLDSLLLKSNETVDGGTF